MILVVFSVIYSRQDSNRHLSPEGKEPKREHPSRTFELQWDEGGLQPRGDTQGRKLHLPWGNPPGGRAV